jgi:hypothetical protein
MIKHRLGNFEIIEYTGSIFVIKNLLDTSFCKTFINYIDSCNTYEITYNKGMNVKGYEAELFTTQHNIKDTKQKLIYKLIADILINIYIKCIVNIILKLRCDIFKKQIPKFGEIYIRKITGETKTHYDGINTDNYIRCLTCVMALNNNYENGKFYFENQNINIKLDTGDVLLFPPYWTHLHSVEKPLNNDRYTITFWFYDYISNEGNILEYKDFPI